MWPTVVELSCGDFCMPYVHILHCSVICKHIEREREHMHECIHFLSLPLPFLSLSLSLSPSLSFTHTHTHTHSHLLMPWACSRHTHTHPPTHPSPINWLKEPVVYKIEGEATADRVKITQLLLSLADHALHCCQPLTSICKVNTPERITKQPCRSYDAIIYAQHTAYNEYM